LVPFGAERGVVTVWDDRTEPDAAALSGYFQFVQIEIEVFDPREGGDDYGLTLYTSLILGEARGDDSADAGGLSTGIDAMVGHSSVLYRNKENCCGP